MTAIPQARRGSPLPRLFSPAEQYEGVRPIQIHLLRLVYLLMALFIATRSWRAIATHTGPWDPYRGLAFCVWATYTTLGVLGLRHPLRLLPIMVFMIAYKTLWLAVVAYPLWTAGTLAGSPAESLATVFRWAPIMALFVPWSYFVRQFVTANPVRPSHK